MKSNPTRTLTTTLGCVTAQYSILINIHTLHGQMRKLKLIFKYMMKSETPKSTAANLGVAITLISFVFIEFFVTIPFRWPITYALFAVQGIALINVFRHSKSVTKWWKWYDKHDWFGKDKDEDDKWPGCGWAVRKRSLEMYDLEIYLKYGPCMDPKKGRIKTCWEIKKNAWDND